MDYVVVTRHAALVAYLIELGLITPSTPVVAHATKENVLNKDIIGVLPMHLAAWTSSISEVPLNLTADMRGRELTLEEVRACAQPLVKYIVRTAARHGEELDWEMRYGYSGQMLLPLEPLK